MADDVDRANEVAEVAREAEIQSMRNQRRVSLVEDCEDCGEPIPKARKQAYPAATRCIFCQELVESNT